MTAASFAPLTKSDQCFIDHLGIVLDNLQIHTRDTVGVPVSLFPIPHISLAEAEAGREFGLRERQPVTDGGDIDRRRHLDGRDIDAPRVWLPLCVRALRPWP